jgi:two-component system, cell cycle response regulator CtrA
MSCPHCALLEIERDRAEARALQLEAALRPPDGWNTPLEWGLTRAEAQTVGALISREQCTKQALMLATTTAVIVDDDREVKIVDVFVCKLRKKLEPFGWRIETVWGRGYAIPADQRAAIAAGAVQWTPPAVRIAS